MTKTKTHSPKSPAAKQKRQPAVTTEKKASEPITVSEFCSCLKQLLGLMDDASTEELDWLVCYGQLLEEARTDPELQAALGKTLAELHNKTWPPFCCGPAQFKAFGTAAQ